VTCCSTGSTDLLCALTAADQGISGLVESAILSHGLMIPSVGSGCAALAVASVPILVTIS
jgi:hypothetical protein